MDFAISDAEREIADKSVQMALDAGASAVMVSLDKAKTEIYALLDGEIDNIRQTGDRSLTFNIYADGKYGTFSTNRFEEESLRDFLCKAVETVRMLVADPFRGLPDKKDLATDAVNGDEMGLCWYGYDSVSRDENWRWQDVSPCSGNFRHRLLTGTGVWYPRKWNITTHCQTPT